MSLTTVLLICAFLFVALVLSPLLAGTPLSTIANAFLG